MDNYVCRLKLPIVECLSDHEHLAKEPNTSRCLLDFGTRTPPNMEAMQPDQL